MVARAYTRTVRRAYVLWWIGVCVGVAGASALLIAVYLFDSEPSHLLFAALPAYGIALGLARRWLPGRSGSNDSPLPR
jgi:hypothetical protein